MAAVLLSWLAIGVLALALSGLVRQVRILEGQLTSGSSRRRVGPEVGQAFDAPDRVFGARDYLLVFADSQCASCVDIIPRFLEGGESIEPPGLTSFVVFRGEAPADVYGSAHILENQSALFMQVGVSATPFAVRVREGQVAAAGLVGSVEVLREMARVESEA